jgi:hypothetical protein
VRAFSQASSVVPIGPSNWPSSSSIGLFLGASNFFFFFLDGGPLSLAFHLKEKKKKRKKSHSQSNWGGGLPISH